MCCADLLKRVLRCLCFLSSEESVEMFVFLIF